MGVETVPEMILDNLTILEGDCANRLREIEPGSVQLVVTSPPYDNLRTYDGYNIWDFESTALELYRVLCDGGLCCWNVDDSVVNGSETLTSCKQKIFFVEECGFRCHQTIIYGKLNFSKPTDVRYHDVSEYIFVFSKGKPRAINLLRDRKNITAGQSNFGRNTKRERDGSLSERAKSVSQAYGVRHNIWIGPTRGQEEPCKPLPQPAMMPKWLARDLILSWSNIGDTVLDPFLGSGTTAMEAIGLGRKAIGIEKNPEYVALAKQFCHVTPGFQLV